MTEATRRYRLELVLIVLALAAVASLATALRAGAAPASEPAADPFVVRATPVRVWSSTATVTQGVRVDRSEDACAPKRLTVLAPENCP